MNKSEKEHLRQVIIRKIEKMRKDIETFKKLSQPVSPDNAIGRITRMEAINSKSINEASLANATVNLEKLRKALESMNDPDFGYCGSCEEPIPYKRLMVMPETPFCVACANKIVAD